MISIDRFFNFALRFLATDKLNPRLIKGVVLWVTKRVVVEGTM